MSVQAAEAYKGGYILANPSGSDRSKLLGNFGPLWDRAQVDPIVRGLSPAIQRSVVNEKAVFSPGATANLITHSGAGVVTSIWAAIYAAAGQVWATARLNVYVDGEVTPSVSFDVGLLGSYGTTHGKDLATQHTDALFIDSGQYGNFRLSYPIPYATSIKIDLVFWSASGAADLWSQVIYQDGDTTSLRLKSKSRAQQDLVTLTAPQYYEFLNLGAGASGWIVFHAMYCSGVADMTYLENDINLYLNGEGSPGFYASGTEDWFQSSFYFLAPAGLSYCNPIMYQNNTWSGYQICCGLDILAWCGGLRYTNGAKLTWDDLSRSVPSDTSANMTYVVLYYEETPPA